MKKINKIMKELKELEPIENVCGGIIFNNSDLLIWSNFGNEEWYLTHTYNIHIKYASYSEVDIEDIKYYINKLREEELVS